MCDVLVIGAGPAGSLVSLLLARAGHQVVLVEQHHFPRDKVCGECLSALGIDVVSRAGLCEFPISPVILRRTFIHTMDGESAEIPLPRPMWGLSRRVLDDHLLRSALRAGVKVLQPARCESLTGRPAIRDLITNKIEHIKARYVLRADGKAASNQATGEFGIKTHFVGVEGKHRDAIELFAVEGSYGGIAPIEGGRWNAAFVVPATRLRKHRGDVDALFAGMMRENRMLSLRLHNARRVGPWLASPLPRFAVQNDWPDQIIPIGNSVAAIEPIGGEGMGLALHSAELAASAVIHSTRTGQPVDLNSLRRDYRRIWNVRGIACRLLAMGVSCASAARAVAPAIEGCDALLAMAMSLMGKSAIDRGPHLKDSFDEDKIASCHVARTSTGICQHLD